MGSGNGNRKDQAAWEGKMSWGEWCGESLKAKHGQILKRQDWLPNWAVDALKVMKS